jgi:catechol 2,3-dioxygenase-like lactoylglutathione lyase family enzyme
MVALKGVQHVGVTVKNLEKSLQFYETVLGISAAFSGEGGGEELAQAVSVPEAELKFAFLTVGDSTLELLQYTNPTGENYRQRNCDVGAIHIAFEVDDIDAACAALNERGITFTSAPIHIPEGPLAGCAFAYFFDPDGLPLELFQTAD